MNGRAEHDLILVGGGLANGLVALRLAEVRPELRVLVLEAGAAPGGNHTWSFHERDLDAAQRRWIAPLVCHGWPGYEVRFPHFSRRVALGYRSIASARFADLLRAALGPRLRCGAEVRDLYPDAVVLRSGETLRARAVLDGRGFAASPHLHLAYQKFVGQELLLDAPHGLSSPLLMDACVEQFDGYRFVYVLPLAPDRLLVEDTYYSGVADLDREALRGRIARYAAAAGWRIREIAREEEGILPVVLGGAIEAFLDAGGKVPRSGLRAALFHQTTGYSLPDAVRLADLVAALPDITPLRLRDAIDRQVRSRWRAQRFFRLLNRMLFLAGKPEDRYKVMRRFYRLADPLIAHFYAGRLSARERLRLLSGKPPVPVLGALRALLWSGRNAP